MKEIETKLTDFDERKVKNTLEEKAIKVSDRIQKRWVFNINNGKEEVDEFIRIRTDGVKTTLAYKYRKGSGLSNTEEFETDISDFDVAATIFKKIMPDFYYQENRRVTYKYKDAEITMDYWPMVAPVIEIEAPQESMINAVIDELNIIATNKGNVSMAKIYAENGVDIHSYKELKLDTE